MDRGGEFRREGAVFGFPVVGVLFPDSDLLNDRITQGEQGSLDGVEGVDFGTDRDEALHDRSKGGGDDVTGTRSTQSAGI